MRTVLVVDDSSTIRMSLKSTLEIAGYQVELAISGAQALERIAGGLRPDVVITDINMPDIDGLAFIQQARRTLRFTPILALTTESQVAKRDEARRLGATGWMLKPISGQALLGVLRQVSPLAA